MSTTQSFGQSASKTFQPMTYKGRDYLAPEKLFRVPADMGPAEWERGVLDALQAQKVTAKAVVEPLDDGSLRGRIIFPHRVGKKPNGQRGVISSDATKFRVSMIDGLRDTETALNPDAKVVGVDEILKDKGLFGLSLQESWALEAAQRLQVLQIAESDPDNVTVLNPATMIAMSEHFKDPEAWVMQAAMFLSKNGVEGQFSELNVAETEGEGGTSALFRFANEHSRQRFDERRLMDALDGLKPAAVEIEKPEANRPTGIDALMERETDRPALVIGVQSMGITRDPVVAGRIVDQEVRERGIDLDF